MFSPAFCDSLLRFPDRIITRLSNTPYDATGVPHCQRTGWDILVDHTSGTDDAIIANGYSGQDTDVRSYPHVVAYRNRPGVFQTTVSLIHINGMTGGIKAAIGGDEDIVAKRHLSAVKNHAVHIGIKVLSDLHVIAIVAEERLLYQEISSRLPQQAGKEARAPFHIGGQQMVVFVADVLAALPFGYQLSIVVGII